MASTDAPKAGKYELLRGEFHEYDKDDKGRDKDLVKVHTAGSIVELNAEQAERLTTGENPTFGVPGAVAKAKAEALRAEADRLAAEAEEAQARAKDGESTAKAAARSGSRAASSDDTADEQQS